MLEASLRVLAAGDLGRHHRDLATPRLARPIQRLPAAPVVVVRVECRLVVEPHVNVSLQHFGLVHALVRCASACFDHPVLDLDSMARAKIDLHGGGNKPT